MYIFIAMAFIVIPQSESNPIVQPASKSRSIQIQLLVDGLIDDATQKKIEEMPPFYLDENLNYTDIKHKNIETKDVVRLSTVQKGTMSLKIIMDKWPDSNKKLEQHLKVLCDECGTETNITIYIYCNRPVPK